MEDDLYGRQPQWKMNSMEDNLNERRLNERQTQWKTMSMEDDIKEALQEACLARQLRTEPGPAQPQLFY